MNPLYFTRNDNNWVVNVICMALDLATPSHKWNGLPFRSPSADCKTMTEELEMEKEGEENRRDDKKRLKSQVIHVSSQKTLENQCAQQ